MSDSKLTTGQQVYSIWKLGGLTPAQLAKKVIYEIGDDDLLGRASELAYNFLLAVFPLMLFLLALFGLFASRGLLLRSRLLIYFADMLPPMAYDLFSNTVNELANNPGGGKLGSRSVCLVSRKTINHEGSRRPVSTVSFVQLRVLGG